LPEYGKIALNAVQCCGLRQQDREKMEETVAQHAHEGAETLALQALTWLLGQEELLPVFLGSTGASGESLAAGAGDPVFLASVLDFLLMDDAWVIACADGIGCPYPALATARAALPGAAPHWT
jgi:hypothetical protein